MRSLIEYITDPAHNLRFRYVLELYKFDPMIQSAAQHSGCAVVASFKSYRHITLRIVGYHFSSRLIATLNLCPVYLKLVVRML